MAEYISENTGKAVVIECRFCRKFRDEHVPATALAGQWEHGVLDDLPRWVPVCDMHMEGWFEEGIPEESRLPHFPLDEVGGNPAQSPSTPAHTCAECGKTGAGTYVVTVLDAADPKHTRTEVCRECDEQVG